MKKTTAKRRPAAKAAPTGPTIITPRSLLLPYQGRWSQDSARFKIGCMARQVGKDFGAGDEGIRDCFEAELAGTKVDWLIAAPSERQSLESLEKWKDWAKAYQIAIADITEERENNRSEALLKSSIITFPHGSRVIAVPGKPETVRGFSANVLLTEFAFFEDADKTWRAIYPTISNPLRGLKKIRLISTPNGKGNKFSDIWHESFEVKGSTWSAHRVTIHEAVAQGLPVNVEELRAGLNDPEGWAQEYECQFLDTASILLPYDVIALAESVEATEYISPEFWLPSRLGPASPRFVGIDFGRKRNLTVVWTGEMMGDVLATREVLCLRNMSTPDQFDLIRPRVATAARCCIDYTGPGVGLGDLLVKQFSEWKPKADQFGRVELCTFTNELKQDIFPKLRMAFEARRLRIPISRDIREDLHSIHRVVTPAGNVTYRAPMTEDGHADRATALALAIRASGPGGVPAKASSVRRTEGRRRIV